MTRILHWQAKLHYITVRLLNHQGEQIYERAEVTACYDSSLIQM